MPGEGPGQRITERALAPPAGIVGLFDRDRIDDRLHRTRKAGGAQREEELPHFVFDQQ